MSGKLTSLKAQQAELAKELSVLEATKAELKSAPAVENAKGNMVKAWSYKTKKDHNALIHEKLLELDFKGDEITACISAEKSVEAEQISNPLHDDTLSECSEGESENSDDSDAMAEAHANGEAESDNESVKSDTTQAFEAPDDSDVDISEPEVVETPIKKVKKVKKVKEVKKVKKKLEDYPQLSECAVDVQWHMKNRLGRAQKADKCVVGYFHNKQTKENDIPHTLNDYNCESRQWQQIAGPTLRMALDNPDFKAYKGFKLSYNCRCEAKKAEGEKYCKRHLNQIEKGKHNWGNINEDPPCADNLEGKPEHIKMSGKCCQPHAFIGYYGLKDFLPEFQKGAKIDISNQEIKMSKHMPSSMKKDYESDSD